MACRENRGLYLGLFMVYSSLCQCISLKKLQTSHKLGENATLSRAQGERSHSYYGKLLIGLNSVQDTSGTKTPEDFLDVDSDYQSDMPQGRILGGWGAPGHLKLDNIALERLLKMDPTVECTGDSMRLLVQDADSTTPGALFSVDRGSLLSPLPLSMLPQSCGYTVPSTSLVLVAPYDGCFITLEMGCYILPLYWWGIPVRMSCPLRKPSSPHPPMVTCHPMGMVVKTAWTPPASKMKVNVNGDWEPLTRALPRCGFSVVAHPEGVVISIRYTPCLENKDGMYSIGLFGDDGETKISCPSWSPPPAYPTQTPPKFSYNPPNAGQPQVPQPYPPSLFYPWRAAPPPYSQGEEPLYPYPLNIKRPYAPPEWSSTSPPVQTTQSRTWLPYHPFPFYPQPPQQGIPPTWPKPAGGTVGQTLYQINAEFPGEWEQESKLTLSKPPVSEEPLGQIYQSLYLLHPSFAGQSPYQTRVPPTQQTTAPAPMYQEQKPQAPKHPGGPTFETHGNQYYPLDYYSQSLVPFLPRLEKPAVAPEPPITVQPETPKGHIQQLHNLYYYLEQSKKPQPVAIPPAPQKPPLVVHPGDQRPIDAILSQSSYTGISQYHQPHALYLPPVQCPQVCPVGISNCCPQIAFHQHLHHIVPAGNDSKDKTPINPGPTVSPSVALSGFDYDLGYSQDAQKPKEEQETQVGAASPASRQFLPVGMPHGMETYVQPPDGNIAILPGSHPSRGTDPGQVYQHFEQNSQYSYRPVLSQDEDLKGAVETFSGLFPKPQPSHYNAVKPENQYERNSLLENAPLLPQNMKHPFGLNLVDINKRVQVQPSSYAHGERPMSITDPQLYSIPHQMLQDAQAPTLRKVSIPKHSSQMSQLVNRLKKPTKREEIDWSHSEPESSRLLRRGPPGSEFRKSPLPLGELFGESDSPRPRAASNSKNNPQHPQNLKHPQSEPPKWLDKRFSDFDSMPSPGDKSEPLLFSASRGLYSVSLSQEPLGGATKLQAKVEPFKDFWKGPKVLDKEFPAESLQHWSSASDNQQNGLNQPVQKKGNMKQQRPGIVNK